MKIALIIALVVIIVLIFLVLKLRQQASYTEKYNESMRQENQVLLDINRQLTTKNEELNTIYENYLVANQEEEMKLNSLRERISIQDNILRSLSSSAETMRQGAEEQAKSVYEAKLASLNKDYEEKQSILDDEMKKRSLLLLQQIEKEQSKLQDIEAKQQAYIEAQQRAEEMEAKKDYYRLIVEEGDLSDVKLLREIQDRLRRKDSVDKVIYETYYKQPYDVLMSHLFTDTSKVCGIYKITNLENGQAYIGQSVDVRERFRQHIKAALTNGATANKLYQQMKKYGPENFTFEILEIVDRSKLNERETYWIDFYKTKEYGLNSTRGGS